MSLLRWALKSPNAQAPPSVESESPMAACRRESLPGFGSRCRPPAPPAPCLPGCHHAHDYNRLNLGNEVIEPQFCFIRVTIVMVSLRQHTWGRLRKEDSSLCS